MANCPIDLSSVKSGKDIADLAKQINNMFDKDGGCINCYIGPVAWLLAMNKEAWQQENTEEKKPFICSMPCYTSLVKDRTIKPDGQLRPLPKLVRTQARVFVEQDRDISNWTTWKNGCYGCEHQLASQADHNGGCL